MISLIILSYQSSKTLKMINRTKLRNNMIYKLNELTLVLIRDILLFIKVCVSIYKELQVMLLSTIGFRETVGKSSLK